LLQKLAKMIKKITIENEQARERLDVFICKKYPEISRNQIQKAIDDQNIKVNGNVAKPGLKLKTGDSLEINELFILELDKSIELIAENIPLKIIYEDDNLIAVDKPAGLVVHPAHGNLTGTLVNALISHEPGITRVVDTNSSGSNVRPGIVHRLDKDTSGIILVAKNKKTLSFLSTQLQSKKIIKTYLALVYGNTENVGSIEGYIGRDKNNRKRMAETDSQHGKLALTNFKTIKRYKFTNRDLSLLEINIPTGRTHQIRLQMKSIGFPIIGDQTYYTKESKNLSSLLHAIRQMLHAWKIEFYLPESGDRIKLQSDTPDDMSQVLNTLS